MDTASTGLWAIVGAGADDEGSRFENSPGFRPRAEHRAGCGLARVDPGRHNSSVGSNFA